MSHNPEAPKKPQPKIVEISGLKEIDTSINPRDGVRFVAPDGTHFEVSWRSSDQTWSISGGHSLVLRPIASNVLRIGVER